MKLPHPTRSRSARGILEGALEIVDECAGLKVIVILASGATIQVAWSELEMGDMALAIAELDRQLHKWMDEVSE